MSTTLLDEDDDDEYVCGHCQRNQCSRCVEQGCCCCGGVPDDAD